MQVNEIEPAAKDFDVAARFFAVERVFIGDDTARLEMVSQCQRQGADGIQHLIARSIHSGRFVEQAMPAYSRLLR